MNRGGGWNNNAQNCRSANRDRNEPGNRNNNLGFRLASTRSRRYPCVQRFKERAVRVQAPVRLPGCRGDKQGHTHHVW
ncbi:MAG: hypothetical protein AB1641_31640 [Thermodesulfobacteriota bacterium]